MPRLLFIIPPITEKIWSNHYHEIYIGLAYIAGLASKEGFHVKVIDCDATSVTLAQLKRKIKKYNPDSIGITALYGSLKNALKVAKVAKKNSKAQIIMGGLPATFIPDFILKNPNIDILVRGEGESTFMDILKGKSLKKIDGISYRDKDKIYHNKNRKLLENLDLLGIPNREVFPLKKYKIRFKIHNSTAIETSRGCPYGCDFCTQKPKEGGKLRLRSPKMVLAELKDIAVKYPFIRRIMFVDNDFLTNKNHANEIFRLIIKNRLNKRFHFMIATRVDNILRGGDELLSLMNKANINTVFFGIESVSDKHKKSIGKIKNEQNTITLFKELESLDIDPLPSYIIGYPGEDKNDIKKTLDFAKKLNTKIFSFNILTPYPGTENFAKCIQQNTLKNLDYNKLDNAHQVIKHNLDLKKEFRKIHRLYVFRIGYFSKIKILEIFKRMNSGRFAFFMYYIVFMELATYLRSVKRFLRKILLKGDHFKR